MIHSLHVKNIALIDELNIEFGTGLNVLSGETGAGKSIIVNSMNLVLGERADRELIRAGQEKASVQAVLYVDNDTLADLFEKHDIEREEEFVVSRGLSIEGKNTCRINGVAVNLATLKEFMERIVDIHGQHEHQSLLYAKNHLYFLDIFGHKELEKTKREIAEQYEVLLQYQKKLNSIGGDRKTREQTMDLLEFQLKEIEEAALYSEELEVLEEEREILRNAQTIFSVMDNGYQALYLGTEDGVSVTSLLQASIHALQQVASISEQYKKVMERLEESYYTIEECAHDMRVYADEIVFDEARQNEVEERIAVLHALLRKYDAPDLQGILDYKLQAEQQLEDLKNSEQIQEELLASIEEQKRTLYRNYEMLHACRKKVAQELADRLLEELKDLGMKEASFEVKFEPFPAFERAQFSANGLDEVEFFITTNAGEPMKPLAKTVSGGEVSRIMLAFKNISAQADRISTIVFDEIDTGLSGKMAHVVAKKMAEISKFRQVICVTHLPQIAAMADQNYLIQKQSGTQKTLTSIRRIRNTEVVAEVARLSGGLDSEHSLAYAEELLKNAGEVKKGLAE